MPDVYMPPVATDYERAQPRYVLLAPSYLGKTTAHNLGLSIDPEEVVEYRSWRDGWGNPTLASDPEWRAKQRDAYIAMCMRAYRSSATFVTAHPFAPHLVADADFDGRHIVALIPDYRALNRARSQQFEEVRAGKPYSRSRREAFDNGLAYVLALARSGTRALYVDTVADAIATIRLAPSRNT